MGQKKNREYTKHVYKKTTQKYYVKGDEAAERKIRLSDSAIKAVALTFYPFYLAVSGTGKLVKKIKSTFKSRTAQNTYKLSLGSSNALIGTHLPKVKAFFKGHYERSKEATKGLAEKSMPFVKKNKWALGAVSAALLLTLSGAMLLKNTEATAMMPEEPPTHVVAAIEKEDPEVLALETAISSAETTVVETPEFKVYSAASARAYEIKANGKTVARFKTEEEAELLLQKLKEEYTLDQENEILEAYFSEVVEIEHNFVDIMDFEGYDNVDDAVAFIKLGTREEKTHVVQKGENYWVIANYYGISPYDLESANPEIKPERLQIGMEISLVVPTPLITVSTVERLVYTDKIAFDVVYEQTSNLFKGETKTKVNGVQGERVVEAEIIRQNGREIARTILSEEVKSQPQARVVYQGTKNPPPKVGTGSMIRPLSGGYVSSEFGPRGRGRHYGIDIAVNRGTPIVAADGGTVSFAGWGNSYGYYVIIDHGGNISTLYAHNSQLAVKRGDRVHQGQIIAYSGNTGNSTGAHLHFEVRVNGVKVNPRNYVRF